MSGRQNVNGQDFDITAYTAAPLKMDLRIEFRGKTPAEVFEIMGDPARITDWYLLAKEVRMQQAGDHGQTNFNVVFTFFGDVYEEILHWDPPHRYVYRAEGENFPIKDYVAMIEVSETGTGQGLMRWRFFCSVIEGEDFQRILPVILPPINEESIKRLAPLIGGVRCEAKNYF